MEDAGDWPSSHRTAVALEPREGDVVVTRVASPVERHTVARVPGSTQAIVATQEDAIGLARELAKLWGVDLWYAADDAHRLIDAFRPSEEP